MIWARETAAKGARALGLALSIQLASSGCLPTESNETVKSPVLERRTPVDPGAPLVTSEWRVEGGKVVGHVQWSACKSERTWAVEEQHVKRVRPQPTAGWLALGVGALAGAVAVAAYHRPGTVCTDTYPQVAGSDDPITPALASCHADQPDNSVSGVALAVGAIAIVTGLVLLAVRPSEQVTVLKHEPHAESEVGSCVSPAELSDMSLVLKLGPSRFAHVTLQPDGEAAADLSARARLPKGADLPVLVYRAPPALKDALPRFQVIGQVHVPE